MTEDPKDPKDKTLGDAKPFPLSPQRLKSLSNLLRDFLLLESTQACLQEILEAKNQNARAAGGIFIVVGSPNGITE